jgi:hypothetical protein
MDDKDQFPDLQATIIQSGTVELAPTSISFLAISAAGNTNCQ